MSWLDFLAQNALRGTLILTAAFAAAAVLRRASAAMRSLVWTCCCAALLALPVAILIVPKWSPPATPAGSAVAQPVDLSVAMPMAPGATQPAPASRARRLDWLATMWALGCAASGAWFLLGFSRASRMVRRAGQATYARAALEDMRAALDIGRPVRVLETGAAPMPLAWGILRPVVILPLGASEWPKPRLHAVLLHELVHALRFDLAAQAVAQASCCLYWFNPLVWFAARQLRKERERACDDAVLRHVTAPDYAGHLMELARGMAARRMRWGGALAMAQPSDLEARVRALLDRKRDRRPLTRRVAIAAVAIVCAVLLPVAAVTARAQTAAAAPAPPAPLSAEVRDVEAAPAPDVSATASEPAAADEAAPAGAEPQSATGSLAGVVLDPSAAVVPNCEVTARNLDGSNREVTRTNEVGEYHFTAVPPGRYTVEARMPGFNTFSKEVAVVAGLSTRVDANLEIGSATEEVQVTAARSTSAAPGAPSGAPQRIRVGGNLQIFRVIFKVPPVYPEDLKQAGIEGTVVLRDVISKQGTVLNPQVVNTEIDPRLAQAAIAAVSQWIYQPTLLNGQPVETQTTIQVVFRLH